ncbi:helix-turn-helix domain-containing protein [Prescottella defluvii]
MIARLTRILDAFDTSGSVLSLEAVAFRTGLTRSSTHRIIVQLTASGWIQRMPDGGYRLGSRAFRFRGAHSESHDHLRSVAVEPLRSLHIRTGLVSHLAVLDGPDVLILDKFGGPSATLVPSRIGGRHAPHISTGGRAMLAALPAETVDEIVADRLERSRSTWTRQRMYQELSRIRRRRGIAIDETGRDTRDIASVAASIILPGLPPASICVCLNRASDALRVVPLVAAVTRSIESLGLPAAALPGVRAHEDLSGAVRDQLPR